MQVNGTNRKQKQPASLTLGSNTELRSIMSLESVAKNIRDADAPGVATARANASLHCAQHDRLPL